MALDSLAGELIRLGAQWTHFFRKGRTVIALGTPAHAVAGSDSSRLSRSVGVSEILRWWAKLSGRLAGEFQRMRGSALKSLNIV